MINGFSELMAEIFGDDNGVGARSAKEAKLRRDAILVEAETGARILDRRHEVSIREVAGLLLLDQDSCFVRGEHAVGHGRVERGADVDHGLAHRPEVAVGIEVQQGDLVVILEAVGVELGDVADPDHPVGGTLRGAERTHAGGADDPDPLREGIEDLLVERRHRLHEGAIDERDRMRAIAAYRAHDVAHARGRQDDGLGIQTRGFGRRERRAEEHQVGAAHVAISARTARPRGPGW